MLITSAYRKPISVIQQDLVSINLLDVIKGYNFRPVDSQKFIPLMDSLIYMLQCMIAQANLFDPMLPIFDYL